MASMIREYDESIDGPPYQLFYTTTLREYAALCFIQQRYENYMILIIRDAQVTLGSLTSYAMDISTNIVHYCPALA